MAKQLVSVVKFHATGGKATAAPPVGTALGKYGLNLGQFVKQFNDKTQDSMGLRVPVVVHVYSDRTFELETKSPHSVDLLKQAAGIVKGSSRVPKEKVGTITVSKIKEVANRKWKDLNCRDIEQAVHILSGTARSMGLDVIED